MGQNKDNMLINDLTVVAVIRKFDGVAMYPPQIHPIESSTYFGSTYLIPTSKNLNSSYGSIHRQTNHHNKRVNPAMSKYIFLTFSYTLYSLPYWERIFKLSKTLF